MDMSGFQEGATYEDIQKWIQEKDGIHVSHLNIAKTKRKCGIIEGQNYILPKKEDSRLPETPKEKEEAIMDDFLPFKMMWIQKQRLVADTVRGRFGRNELFVMMHGLTSDPSFTIISERRVTLLYVEEIMANDTKERILEAALEMFSQNGYAGTNIRELSASLGLVKSGVYKHYESKEAIWNALLDQMIAYYGEHFGSAEHLPPVPDSLEEFVQMTMQMVNITVHDEKIIMTRKVLTLEQFRDMRARELATKHFLTGLTEIFTHIFAGMMDKGLILRDDPAMLAFAYTTPISALIHLCDREPEKTEGAIAQIEAFSRHFIATYGVK